MPKKGGLVKVYIYTTDHYAIFKNHVVKVFNVIY